jgi:5-methylcytosine-specific restriction endonuclease McrA
VVENYRFLYLDCEATKNRVSREHKLPARERLSGRRAFASHEVEWSTRAMKALKNIRRTKMLAQGGHCYYCGLPMWDDGLEHRLPAICKSSELPKILRCTAEHLLPRSEGGANSGKNIVAACWFCNTSRHRRKLPLSPGAYRAHVQRRMAAGRWLAGQM